jgi:NAD(P)-dependent dehydrogenase (short-subunit alcohol dehydrogenase family)
MSSRIAVVTGANAGIGYEIAKQLVHKGLKVYVCARTAEKGNPAVYDLFILFCFVLFCFVPFLP